MENLELKIVGFKCFEDAKFTLPALTVLTGVNSGGKTSVIQAVLLLKDRFHAEQDGTPGLWPSTLGGISIGSPSTSIRNSVKQSEISLVESKGFAALGLHRDGLSFRVEVPPPCLSAKWRVVSTVALELSVEQSIGNRTLDDIVYDNAHALLELHDFDVLKKHPSQMDSGLSLRSAVERVLSRITLDTQIDVRSSGIPGKLSLMYAPAAADGELTTPEQYGAGVTVSLPLCVHLCAALPGEVLIVQDPESHLHPRGQSLVGRELARCASRGVRVIVETHSEHVVNGIKLGLLQADKDPSETLCCYYLSSVKDSTPYEIVEIDKHGLTRKWPHGFFDQTELDLADLAGRLKSGE